MTRSHLKPGTAQGAVRHEAIRTCAGCGAKKPQREMLRLASKQGAPPQLDYDFKLPGRGAYLCRDAKCARTAFARRALERTLQLNNALSPAMREEIERAAGSPFIRRTSGVGRMNDTNENGKGGLR
jgi:uncharacterized protein